MRDEFDGSECIESNPPHLTLSKGYLNDIPCPALEVNSDVALRHLIESTSGLPAQIIEELRNSSDAEEMVQNLTDAEQTEAVQELTPKLQQISEQGVPCFIYEMLGTERLCVFDTDN